MGGPHEAGHDEFFCTVVVQTNPELLRLISK